MLEAIIAGQRNPEQLAKLARGRLRSKIPQLEQAPEWRARHHHRFLLTEYLNEWEPLASAHPRPDCRPYRRLLSYEGS
jgi:transposase